MNGKSFLGSASLFFCFLLFLCAATAQGTAITFNLDYEFSGGTSPAGTTPWVSATFDDSFGGANTVRLTMSATNLVGTEFVDDWLFNFNSTLDPTQLTFSFIGGSAGTANGVSTGIDAFQADGDGKFDIIFDYPPPPGDFASKFTTGETAVYDITYVLPITASSFNFSSASGGGNGTYHAAAHIQSIGPIGEGSGWIGDSGAPSIVPIPSTLLLLGTGIAGLSGFRKKIKVSK